MRWRAARLNWIGLGFRKNGEGESVRINLLLLQKKPIDVGLDGGLKWG